MQMKRIIILIKTIGIFFLILGIQDIKAQNSDSLSRKFLQYQKEHVQEKIYVHTDRDQYLSGERIWYKVLSLDDSYLKPLSLSRLVYIEILDKDQSPILQIKSLLKNGEGKGSISLPLGVLSGNYTFRAYTSWMRNQGPEFYFTKKISVYNPYLVPPLVKEENKKHYYLTTFPEGGNLVNGISSRIGFKISDQFGRGMDAQGWVRCVQTGKSFPVKTLFKGMGKFELVPQKNLDYVISIKLPDTLIQTSLPKGFDQGYTLRLTIQDSLVKIKIKSKGISSSSKVFLGIRNRNIVRKFISAVLTPDSIQFIFNQKELGEGLLEFTLFNEYLKPIAERIHFINPKQILSIETHIDQQEYLTRSPVSLSIQNSIPGGGHSDADISLSVFLLDSLQELPSESILAYLYLRSELRGLIEEPDYYFNDTNPGVEEARDNLMLTQGWRRVKWEELFYAGTPHFQFLPEMEGFLIKGKITHKFSGIPASNIPSSLTLPGADFDFRPGISDENGNVWYSLRPFLGTRELVSQTLNTSDSLYRIDLENPFSDKYESKNWGPLPLDRNLGNVLNRHSIYSQAQKIFYSKNLHAKNTLETTDTTRFYGIPIRNYKLDDYKRFTNMEEVIREFILDVHLRKKEGNYALRVSNTALFSFFDDPPLVLFDGVFIKDINKLLAFDPLKVKSIEVVPETYIQGALLNEGIISFRTYKGDLAGFNLDPTDLSIEYKGLERDFEFYSPDYENLLEKNNRLPDFRNELFWDPNLISGSDGKAYSKFYTSDLPGTYAIFVQGRNKEGFYGFNVVTFLVKK